MKKKNLILLCIMLVICLTGCSGGSNSKKQNTSSLLIDYVLTTKDGKISGFTSGGTLVKTFDIGGTSKSDFIYFIDQGDVYTKETSSYTNKNTVLYALDKKKSKVYVLSVGKDDISSIASKSLKENNIDSAYAYNGKFYYAVKKKNKLANKFEYIRPEKDKLNGIIDSGQVIQLPKVRDLNTYILFEDFSSEYIKARGLNSVLTNEQMNTFFPKIKGTFEIPGAVTTWVCNGEAIYFFMEDYMGIYLMEKDKIGIFNATPETSKLFYIDGKDKRLLAGANLGENSSKSIVFELDHKDMRIEKAIELDVSEIVDLTADSHKYIHTLHKNTDGSSPMKLKTLDYKTYSEVASVPLKYIPTKVEATNNFVYLFNPFEEYFLVGDAGIGQFTKRQSVIDNIRYTDIFAMRNTREDSFSYDENGRYIDSNGNLINADGELINQQNQILNQYGQKVDVYGRAVDVDGNFLDPYNNIIDKDGNILVYAIGKDGYYRNSKGQRVDQTGELLIQNTDGEWVSKKPDTRPTVPGYYDENGLFVIDKAYLEEYPDAYEYVKKYGKSVIRKYNETKPSEAAETAE